MIKSHWSNIDHKWSNIREPNTESLNSQLRKVTNNKGVFNSEESLEKMIYMKIEKVLEKWGRVPIPNWSGILSQLMIYFEDKNIDWKKLVS